MLRFFEFKKIDESVKLKLFSSKNDLKQEIDDFFINYIDKKMAKTTLNLIGSRKPDSKEIDFAYSSTNKRYLDLDANLSVYIYEINLKEYLSIDFLIKTMDRISQSLELDIIYYDLKQQKSTFYNRASTELSIYFSLLEEEITTIDSTLQQKLSILYTPVGKGGLGFSKGILSQSDLRKLRLPVSFWKGPTISFLVQFNLDKKESSWNNRVAGLYTKLVKFLSTTFSTPKKVILSSNSQLFELDFEKMKTWQYFKNLVLAQISTGIGAKWIIEVKEAKLVIEINRYKILTFNLLVRGLVETKKIKVTN